jgi:hypothetical protein
MSIDIADRLLLTSFGIHCNIDISTFNGEVKMETIINEILDLIELLDDVADGGEMVNLICSEVK